MASARGDNQGNTTLVKYWPVLLFVVVWLGVVLMREPIRVRWWGHRLRSAETERQRLYYFELLCTAGPATLHVAQSLMNEENPAWRGFGVGILHHIEGPQAGELLTVACGDADSAVRNLAAVGLAIRKDRSVLPVLRKMALSAADQEALSATIALAEFDCQAVREILCEIAGRHQTPIVRAQAFQQLGYLRCREAIPELIAGLGDMATYEGSTVLDRFDEEVIKLLNARSPESSSSPYSSARSRIVADQAAVSLRMITGESFGFLSSDGSQRRRAAQTAWRQWWAKQLAS